ncbi:putative nicotinate-nucleotide pyrophosphorylase [Planoprotostelium fungivorum]|uniref:Nicotinate-nucleotide pyrophosphorylase [carboxylating] n=1 Tax=Planoprotostelium fungivorum TaxID=1890364 RepID=A0A2P6MQW0_9EUKA|nr:putative nicotinate-nucleotide pyrophosphorylase [Planoprotostelium fungivorum]
MEQDQLEHLTTFQWDKSTIELWLKEDIPSFDYGGFVVGDKNEVATLFCKQNGVLAGRTFFQEVFTYLGCSVEWMIKEGTHIDVTSAEKKRVPVAIVRGEARKILAGERTALNILARCSGIATRARALRQTADAQGKTSLRMSVVTNEGYRGCIAGTRKTTPGFRAVEKYGIMVGGCDPHRMDLSSMIMLKDNHVWSTGSITKAVQKAKRGGGFALKIDVECQTFEDAEEAAKAGADIVMLDNFAPEELKKTARRLKSLFPTLLIEASGGVTGNTVAEYFDDSVDIISMGSLTQGVPHIDFSLKVPQPNKA